MGKFEKGDFATSELGQPVTILDSTELVLVKFADGGTGTFNASLFEKVQRSYKPGDYVRIVETGVVGIVFDDDGDPEDEEPFWVAAFDADGVEDPYSADELIPWVPLVGEQVLEAGVDDDTEGTITAVHGDEVIVLWDGFPFAQRFAIADLEPIDECEDEDADEDEDEFEVGDSVTYTNPFFAGEFPAQVVGLVNENIIAVEFAPGTAILDGFYNKDFFSKAA